MSKPDTERPSLLEVTEYLAIDLDARRWQCRCCGHDLGEAASNYKFACLVADRDPREVHPPVIDGPYTFAPDPDWCRIVEFYCPGCLTLIEAEYLPPGHPVTHDIEIDIDSLKKKSA
ncbi:acetone carboxylase subunit gamma [Acuticoccus mangrovi]|uniref:Acetone carboxylase subunit gamma n=1 Tax=Acuticoccus mangrovi TaxID=2796142 RepID=A0A934MJ37_9HYPH|nr:acetone carboxylase subunit gamma [Acuticoccus mangrovi]MBJ3778510.1 acetone carboxylase subunit gamma [Acuticoccus mangrovi]